MEDSVSSVSLLEMAGLNTLLDPYEGPGYIRNSISTLQEYTLDMTGALRRFQRWVDSTQREMDTGFPPKDDVRRLFQEYG